MSGSHLPPLGETLGKACEVGHFSLETLAASIAEYDPALAWQVIREANPAPAESDPVPQLTVIIERVVLSNERPCSGELLVEFFKACQECLAPATIQYAGLTSILNDLARHMARIALEEFGLLDISEIT